MQRESTGIWRGVFVGARFSAHSTASSLIRELSAHSTYVDMGALFILGPVAGFALGRIFAAYRT